MCLLLHPTGDLLSRRLELPTQLRRRTTCSHPFTGSSQPAPRTQRTASTSAPDVKMVPLEGLNGICTISPRPSLIFAIARPDGPTGRPHELASREGPASRTTRRRSGTRLVATSRCSRYPTTSRPARSLRRRLLRVDDVIRRARSTRPIATKTTPATNAKPITVAATEWSRSSKGSDDARAAMPTRVGCGNGHHRAEAP